jgi:hypothetical protein
MVGAINLKLIFLTVFLPLLPIGIQLLPRDAIASVDVAFVEIIAPDGHLVQFEKNGRFGHSAIFYHGQWLQAHPWRGVELTSKSEVEKIGCIAEVVHIPDPAELDSKKLKTLIGRPFDHDYTWDDKSLYCAELVAKLLDIPPTPMEFDPNLWPEEFQKHNGEPGISPDGVYRALKARGYKSTQINACPSTD